jgi:hypothetical protein
MRLTWTSFSRPGAVYTSFPGKFIRSMRKISARGHVIQTKEWLEEKEKGREDLASLGLIKRGESDDFVMVEDPGALWRMNEESLVEDQDLFGDGDESLRDKEQEFKNEETLVKEAIVEDEDIEVEEKVAETSDQELIEQESLENERRALEERIKLKLEKRRERRRLRRLLKG